MWAGLENCLGYGIRQGCIPPWVPIKLHVLCFFTPYTPLVVTNNQIIIGSSLSEIRLDITFYKTSRSIQVLIQALPGAAHGATCSKGSKDTI